MRRCPKCNSFFDNSVEICVYDSEELVEVQVEMSQDEGLTGAVVNDRYEVLESIGEGGMGMVYRAKDRRTDEAIALKVLHRDISGDERTVRRFFSEARVLASLTHPNIIRLYDFGKTDEGLLYIAMELLNGSPVDDLIRLGKLSLDDATQIVYQAAAALGEAHLQGVIHRDLKPANIFMERRDIGPIHVTVLDFGIAKIAGSGQNLTATGKVMGTPSYMAPEQIRGGEPDPRTDIYALGAMGYELISGNPPFEADGPIAVLFMHLERPPTALCTLDLEEKVSEGLSNVVDTFLAKAPDDRPRNMMEVRNLLKPFIEGGPEAVESSKEKPADPEEMKETLVFTAESAVAEAKARIAALKINGDVGASGQSVEEPPPPVEHNAGGQEPEPQGAEQTPPELDETTSLSLAGSAEESDWSLGLKMLGVLILVVILAIALAVVAFLLMTTMSGSDAAVMLQGPSTLALSGLSPMP